MSTVWYSEEWVKEKQGPMGERMPQGEKSNTIVFQIPVGTFLRNMTFRGRLSLYL
jgi:hypothetical protein